MVYNVTILVKLCKTFCCHHVVLKGNTATNNGFTVGPWLCLTYVSYIFHSDSPFRQSKGVGQTDPSDSVQTLPCTDAKGWTTSKCHLLVW